MFVDAVIKWEIIQNWKDILFDEFWWCTHEHHDRRITIFHKKNVLKKQNIYKIESFFLCLGIFIQNTLLFSLPFCLWIEIGCPAWISCTRRKPPASLCNVLPSDTHWASYLPSLHSHAEGDRLWNPLLLQRRRGHLPLYLRNIWAFCSAFIQMSLSEIWIKKYGKKSKTSYW